MRPHLTVALAATLAALTLTSTAHAYTLGVGDAAEFPARDSQTLGATAYRVVIDPAVPIATYDARIYAHRAVGQEPQLVIGGNGTQNHQSSRGITDTAVAAAHRWPYAYSISVVNEPNLSGMGVCEYARTFVRSYRALTAAGVKRVLFGEWAPGNGDMQWHARTLHGCGRTSVALRPLVKRVAWHGYLTYLDDGPKYRALNREFHAPSPRLYITEAGAILRNASAALDSETSDLEGLRYWRKMMRAVKRDRLDEVVAWDLHAPPASSAWDSSLIDPNGRPRPAFNLIAASGRI